MSGRIENSSGQPDRVKQALENAKGTQISRTSTTPTPPD